LIKRDGRRALHPAFLEGTPAPRASETLVLKGLGLRQPCPTLRVAGLLDQTVKPDVPSADSLWKHAMTILIGGGAVVNADADRRALRDVVE
jgi:hypothetical protein